MPKGIQRVSSSGFHSIPGFFRSFWSLSQTLCYIFSKLNRYIQATDNSLAGLNIYSLACKYQCWLFLSTFCNSVIHGATLTCASWELGVQDWVLYIWHTLG